MVDLDEVVEGGAGVKILRTGHPAGKNQPVGAAEVRLLEGKIGADLHALGAREGLVVAYRYSLDVHAGAAEDIHGGQSLDFLEAIGEKQK